MKRYIGMIGLAAMVTLSACGNEAEEKAPTTPVVKATPTAQPKKDDGVMTPEEVKVFAGNFEQAMQAVPPDMRNDFHKYMECENAANLKRPADQQKPMTPQRVIEMTAALKANRSLANCS